MGADEQGSIHTLTPCFHPHTGRLLQWSAALRGSWPGPYWRHLRQSDALRCPPGCLQCGGPAGKAQQGHREVSSWTYLHLLPLCCTGSLQLPRRKVEIRPVYRGLGKHELFGGRESFPPQMGTTAAAAVEICPDRGSYAKSTGISAVLTSE